MLVVSILGSGGCARGVPFNGGWCRARCGAGIVRQRGSSPVHVPAGGFSKKGIDDVGNL